jgi:hypothetical protein
VPRLEAAFEGPGSAGFAAEKAVVVFRTADLGSLALARSLLEEAGIPCSVRNERTLGLLPGSLLGPMLETDFRTADLEVLESAAAKAREALEGLDGVVEESRS